MNKQSLTKAQELAIYGNFKNVLVSASAGSGKTFVMINRVIRLIVEERAHLNEILCVTFTELAAREMKQKLADAINKEIEKSSGAKRERLLLELEYLPTAQISTIHAFCSGLLREFFYEAGLDAGFKMLDGDESKSIANRAIDRLFEDLYETEDQNLKVVLPYYFNKRKDVLLKASIIEVYSSLISEAHPLEILKSGERFYQKQGLYEIYEFFKKEFLKRIEEVNEELKTAIYCLSQTSKFYDFACDIENLLDRAKNSNNIFDMQSVITQTKLRKPSVLKNDPEEYQQEDEVVSKFYYGPFASLKKDISAVEVCGEMEDLQNLEGALPVYRALCEIIKKFFEAYKKEKSEENAVDFSDLEHLTFQLLSQNEDVRKEIQDRFKFVFTDEYQDTSGIQEEILQLVSNDNRFMVGDLKQSIYNFRGSSPEIFKNKFENSTTVDLLNEKQFELLTSDSTLPNNLTNCVINLDKNFRSTYAVLQSVNNLFSNVMFNSFGGVDYKNNPMVVGAEYPETEGCVTAYMVEKSVAEENEIQGVYSVVKHLEKIKNSTFSEGEAVAQIIADIYGKPFFDIKSGTQKNIDYGDITILLRNANNTADKFVKQLIRAGIPVSASTKNSIGEYAEVQLAINVLQLINGFNQDIPLVAVLKSPIGKLTDSELMQIRKNHQRGSFCDAYREFLLNGSGYLWEKLNAFDGYFKGIRALADFMPCDQLLTKIMRDSYWDIQLISTPTGDMKLARLNRFIQASGAKKQSIGEFLQGLEQTLKSLTMDYSEENSVKIMSIHASKGLEFPVVILANTANLYSKEDYKGEFVVNKKYGVAICSKDLKTMVQRENAFRALVRYTNKKALKEEELRLLYVAMTRAKNRLYVTGSFSGKNRGKPDFEIPPKEVHGPCDGQTASSYLSVFARTDFLVKEWDKTRISGFEEKQPRQVLIGESNKELKQQIQRNLNFKYEYMQDLRLPVKRSVTAVAHSNEDEAPFEYAPIYGDSSAEKGTAYHRFLETCDFNNSDTETEFNRLIAARLLTEEQEKLIDLTRLKAILKMPVFNSLKGYTLYREQPFTCMIPANMIEPDYSGSEEILVQGILDLLAVKDDQAVIVDYKYTTLKNAEDIIRRYEMQLKLYGYAVKKVLKLNVKKLLIVDIYSAREIEIPV